MRACLTEKRLRLASGTTRQVPESDRGSRAPSEVFTMHWSCPEWVALLVSPENESTDTWDSWQLRKSVLEVRIWAEVPESTTAITTPCEVVRTLGVFAVVMQQRGIDGGTDMK